MMTVCIWRFARFADLRLSERQKGARMEVILRPRPFFAAKRRRTSPEGLARRRWF